MITNDPPGRRSDRRASSVSPRFAVAALAVAFFVLHLPYLPQSLEDVDSINFALGLHAFDVTRHQPHPPGYPLFIAVARGVRLLVGPDARALALVSLVCAALGVMAIAVLYRRLHEGLAGVALAVTAPLYWFTANRPLSDMSGLAPSIAIQAMILAASTPRRLAWAAFCAGVAVGFRSQVFWLTAPLLAWAALKRWSARPPPAGRQPEAAAAVAYAAGVLLWAVPLVAISGGPRGYWHALFGQGAEDLSGIRMLWTTPTPRELADALYYACIAPWAVMWLGAAVAAAALVGMVALWRRDRFALTVLAVGFGPYLVFDLLFQETFTSRYALPLVVPIAFLAARGAQIVSTRAGAGIVVAAAALGAHLGGTSLAAYARQPAPAFRLLADMARTAVDAPPVLALDRREALDLRAPVKYLAGRFPTAADQLPSPPQHEWLEVVRYLNGGGRSPVWYVADPKRTDIDLIQHAEPQRYRWGLPYPVLLDGVRPSEMDWYQLDSPEWWLGAGWALTPEAAGVADADRAGGPMSGADAYLASRVLSGGVVVVGGRNFEHAVSPRVDLLLNGSPIDTFSAPPGPFVRALRLPADASVAHPTLTVRVTPPAQVAIEQFDASASRTLAAFAEGWHEQEFSPDRGLRWRWVSERGDLRIVSPKPAAGLVVRLAGESPLKYFSRPSTLTIRADGAVVFSTELADDFSLSIPVPRPAAIISVETDQTYVPAERSRRTRDRRRLGLRIFSCEVRSVSAPGR